MKHLIYLGFALFFLACDELPPQTFPPQPQQQRQSSSAIIAYVYWGTEPVARVRVALVEIHDTLFTDSNGTAKFSVRAGTYTLRAFNITPHGGPTPPHVDFHVEASPGATKTVAIVDCLPCL